MCLNFTYIQCIIIIIIICIKKISLNKNKIIIWLDDSISKQVFIKEKNDKHK